MAQVMPEVLVAKTLIDIDESLLAEAAAALGTATKKETVTSALLRAVAEARGRRAQGLDDLLTVADRGGFDFDRLDELDR